MQRSGGHHLNIGLMYIPPRSSFFDQNSIALLPLTSCSKILQTCLHMMAWQSWLVTSMPALAQLLVPAKMSSATCYMPLYSRSRDHASHCRDENLLIHTLVPLETPLGAGWSSLQILNRRTAIKANIHFTCYTALGSSLCGLFAGKLATFNFDNLHGCW